MWWFCYSTWNKWLMQMQLCEKVFLQSRVLMFLHEFDKSKTWLNKTNIFKSSAITLYICSIQSIICHHKFSQNPNVHHSLSDNFFYLQCLKYRLVKMRLYNFMSSFMSTPQWVFMMRYSRSCVSHNDQMPAWPTYFPR